VEGEKKLPMEVEQALYRIVQESLANVARHSQAQSAEVCLGYNTDMVELKISDNGQGFDLQNTPYGLGLYSMRERAEIFGGSFRVESEPGKGTRIMIQVPFEPAG
jgi:signal transduction histidine kinase